MSETVSKATVNDLMVALAEMKVAVDKAVTIAAQMNAGMVDDWKTVLANHEKEAMEWLKTHLGIQ